MTAEVPSRQLRNDTRGVLRRVEGGEDVVITVGGRPVAALRPLTSPRRWITREEFCRRFAQRQADPGLRRDLNRIAGEMTDEPPQR